MVNITRDEVMYIASLSRLHVDESEVKVLIGELEELLTYAARVQEIASETACPAADRTVNVFRDDTARVSDAEPIIANAPRHQEHYFIVPVVLE